MDSKLTKVYYSPQGYWKGLSGIKKVAEAANVSEDTSSGLSNKRSGRSIFLRHATSLGQNSTCRLLTRSIRRTFFFCHMTNSRVAVKFTNVRWPLSTSPAVSKKLNL